MNKLELMLTKIILNLFYKIFSIKAIDRNKVVFATPRNDTLEGNLAYIYREIKGQKLDLKCVMLTAKYGYRLRDKIRYLFRLILNTYHFATARFMILDNAYLPVHVIKHRKGTTVIQTWHACGAFKKFGLSTKGMSGGIKQWEESFIHKGYDYAIVSSNKIIPHYAEAFGLDEQKVLPLGVPRTDFFFKDDALDATSRRLRAQLSKIEDKKVLLYAPTFRGRGQDKYIQLPFDVVELKQKLAQEYHLIIKSHPHAIIPDPIMYDPEFLTIVHNKYSLNELFTISDVLITDYSSGIYEYSLLNKPMIFYPYDLEEYEDSNAFYEDYESFVPGPIVRDVDQLVDAILNKKYEGYDVKKFAMENFDHFDGQSSRRFVDTLLKCRK